MDDCVGAECQGGLEIECRIDMDCSEGEFCVQNECVQVAEGQNCEASNDCPFGMHCDLASNACVECLSDDHCELGLICQMDGTCGDGSVECGFDYDCPAGYICEGGICIIDSTNDTSREIEKLRGDGLDCRLDFYSSAGVGPSPSRNVVIVGLRCRPSLTYRMCFAVTAR